MSPRPAPDLDLRRDQVIHAAQQLAESDGWAALTMRRLSAQLAVTQPVIYSAFEGGRQAVIDAVALSGFADLANALEAAESAPRARMCVYLEFAAGHPRTYEAMFSMPTALTFAAHDTPEVMHRAFSGIRDAFPEADGTLAEVVWATLHGLATLGASGRLRPGDTETRLELAHHMLTQTQAR
jgi:AcrR family transcriptional regulator